MTPELVVYTTAPLDYWTGMVPLDRVVASQTRGDPGDQATVDRLPSLLEEAKALAAEHLLFEGDIVQGPYVSFIPDPEYNRTLPVIGWKQRNNGTTFFASLIALPHLEMASDHYVHFSGDGFVKVRGKLW